MISAMFLSSGLFVFYLYRYEDRFRKQSALFDIALEFVVMAPLIAALRQPHIADVVPRFSDRADEVNVGRRGRFEYSVESSRKRESDGASCVTHRVAFVDADPVIKALRRRIPSAHAVVGNGSPARKPRGQSVYIVPVPEIRRIILIARKGDDAERIEFDDIAQWAFTFRDKLEAAVQLQAVSMPAVLGRQDMMLSLERAYEVFFRVEAVLECDIADGPAAAFVLHASDDLGDPPLSYIAGGREPDEPFENAQKMIFRVADGGGDLPDADVVFKVFLDIVDRFLNRRKAFHAVSCL